MKESYNFYRKMLPIVVAVVFFCTNFNTFAKENYIIYPNDLGVAEIIFTPIEDANTDSAYICAHDSITLEAIVVEEPDVEYTYQWYVNKVKMENATKDTYTCLPKDIDSVYCVVKSNQLCSDSTITNIMIITRCFKLYGTVFPFVQEFVEGIANKVFNDLFTVTARLYPVPTVEHGANPIKALMQLTPLHTTTAFYYNGDIHVEHTPKYPGAIGVLGNPGKDINWEPVVGYNIPAPVGYDEVQQTFAPETPVGIYRFNDVKVGEYVLMLSAPGFAYRYGVIKIYTNEDTLLGHRELIPGDINCDALIDHRDLGIVNGMYSNYTDPPVNRYNLMFDLNKDGKVDKEDSKLIINNYGGFSSMFYQETWEWLFSY